MESEMKLGHEDEFEKTKKLQVLNTGSWSDDELKLLIEALNTFKWGNWEELAGIVQTRSQKQISDKLFSVIAKEPTIKTDSYQLKIDLFKVAIKRRVEYKKNDGENELSVLKEESNDSPKEKKSNLNLKSEIPEDADIKSNDETTDNNSFNIPWTEIEHEALLKGLKNHKWDEWNEISKYIESRSVSQVQRKCRNLCRDTSMTGKSELIKDLRLLAETRKKEYLEAKKIRNGSQTDWSSSTSETGTISSISAKSSTKSVEINNFINTNSEAKAEPITESNEITPTPLSDSTNDSGVVMGEESTATTSDFDMAGANTGMEKEDLVPESIKEDFHASGKRSRKLLHSAPTKPQAKTVSKPSQAVPAKKRTYTRKSRTAVPFNVGEEVSILSSSSSGEFELESVNIMSSSSSSSNHSISSLPSVLSAKESINSKTSKSSKASSKTSKESSTESVNSSTSIVEDWVKTACPAIFMKQSLLNPERKYLEIKQQITRLIAANPEISDEELHQRLHNSHSAASIEQVLQIVRGTSISETPAVPPFPKKKQKDAVADDFEVLKKLSTTLSGRKRKIRSEEGEWIDPNEIEGRVISHEPATPAKEKRKRKYVRKEMADGVDDLSTTEDPFRLILLNDYEHDHANEDYDILKAPFIVEMCSSVILLMDLHSHLHSSEIIGLLGGTMQNDLEVPVLRINYGYPCLTAHSTGTQVDVDPLSEMEAGEFFEGKNVRMTGWYHSHPNFEPNPSLRDLETQTMYQGLFRNALPGSDIEPFVGVIVNPYLAITESSSHVECFYVAPNPDPSQERLPYRLPIRRKPFNPADFPQILEKMREIIFRAQSSPDRLDMQRNAEPGVKRIEKLFKSLQFHGDLTAEQMEQIKELFK